MAFTEKLYTHLLILRCKRCSIEHICHTKHLQKIASTSILCVSMILFFYHENNESLQLLHFQIGFFFLLWFRMIAICKRWNVTAQRHQNNGKNRTKKKNNNNKNSNKKQKPIRNNRIMCGVCDARCLRWWSTSSESQSQTETETYQRTKRRAHTRAQTAPTIGTNNM